MGMFKNEILSKDLYKKACNGYLCNVDLSRFMATQAIHFLNFLFRFNPEDKLFGAIRPLAQ